MNTALLIVLIVAIAGIAIAALWYFQKRRSQHLQTRFGREYDHAVEQFGDQRKAETELERREKRVERFAIHGLPREQRDRFAEAWRAGQARFVDEPQQAVIEAHRLVDELMKACGYPVSAEFESNAADLSVRHASVVEHYRIACDIASRQERGQANTEDLRTAMVHYRALFEELLGASVQEPQPQEVRQ